jgi:Flp pilus assembly protein TadG
MGMIPHINVQTPKTAVSTAASSSFKKTHFILTRKNQKGQVAIFVALIFQVVFVFFALMINVGLLVHQKINLQHSTDLAAYYGAMKQAEQLNAIAHINFQMRQAWKLWTWRYRILGTFGMMQAQGGTPQSFAFNSTGNGFNYYGTMGSQATAGSPYTNGNNTSLPIPLNCSKLGDSSYNIDGTPLGVQDIPFFCIGHSGFKAWPQTENNCQLKCEDFSSAKVIDLIPSLATTYNTPWSNNMAASVNSTISKVNDSVIDRCARTDLAGGTMFARFLWAFATESVARSETIKMLAANLSRDADNFVDIEGNSIKVGSQ